MSQVDDESIKEANLLAGDAINNFRTIMSFGNTEMVVKKFDDLLEDSHKSAVKNAHVIGFLYGFS